MSLYLRQHKVGKFCYVLKDDEIDIY